jgi:hypothetical protein
MWLCGSLSLFSCAERGFAFTGRGGGGSGQPEALRDPSICKHGCGLNMTQTLPTECLKDSPNPGYHLYCSQWKDYPWRHLLFASDYTSRRLFRRLLLHGFAIVMPQAWGAQASPQSLDAWYAYDNTVRLVPHSGSSVRSSLFLVTARARIGE